MQTKKMEMGKFDIEARSSNKGCYIREINEFLHGNHENMKYTFESVVGASRCASYLSVLRRKKGFAINIIRRGNVVYITRRDKDADTQD